MIEASSLFWVVVRRIGSSIWRIHGWRTNVRFSDSGGPPTYRSRRSGAVYVGRSAPAAPARRDLAENGLYDAGPFVGATGELLRACGGGFVGNVIRNELPTPTVDSQAIVPPIA